MATTQKRSGGSRATSSRGGTQTKRSGGTGGRGSKKNAPKPMRREIGAGVCLLLAVCCGLGYLQMQALFIDFFCGLMKGLLGYGFWLLCPCLLLASFILAFHRGRPVLLRLCCALLGDAALAEDAVQDTFIRAWRALPHFRGDSSEKTWLTHIAVNVCRDLQRKGWFRHEDRRVSLDTLPEPAAPCTAQQDTLARAVLCLPLPCRQAVLLRYYQQMTLPEAAQALGISLSTMNRRLRRAKTLLKKELEEG